jgi:putative transposase
MIKTIRRILMKARKYTEEQIIAVHKEGEAGAKVVDICLKYGMR